MSHSWGRPIKLKENTCQCLELLANTNDDDAKAVPFQKVLMNLSDFLGMIDNVDHWFLGRSFAEMFKEGDWKF